jgi:hypothetical protein
MCLSEESGEKRIKNLCCRAVLSASASIVLAVCVLLLIKEPAVQAQAATTHFAPEILTASTPITLDVPILLYHQIGGNGSRYNMPVRVFAAQMEYLSKLGIPITTFAYPFGSLSSSVERAVEDAGYTAAVWTGSGVRHTSDRIYKLKRIGVYFPMSLATFRARLPKHGPTGAGTCPPTPRHNKIRSDVVVRSDY